MWNLYYRNYRLLIVTIFSIIFFGLFAYYTLPRMEDPELSQWYALVNTSFPGASAEKVESLVTKEIEQELFEVEEIKTISSISRFGYSTISINLKDTVKNFDEVWSRVRDRINDIIPELPEEAQPPEYVKIDQQAYTKILALVWNSALPTNYNLLRRQAIELEDKLRIIEGTKNVKLFGSPKEEITVEIDLADLTALGLTAEELSLQIFRSDAKVAAGQLRSNLQDLLIEVKTEFDSLDRIKKIPIRSGDSSQFTFLEDIAVIKKNIREPLADMVVIDGKPAIAIAIRMESNQNIQNWFAINNQKINDFQHKLPKDINLKTILNQNSYVKKRLDSLFKNVLLGVLFVFVSTSIMMGWRLSLVIGSALPLSILMVFAGMKIVGIPLHQMSVTGLVIVLGLLIDNAIVVADEVQNQLHQGFSPQDAVSRTTNYLANPLLASTLTSILSFIPIVLIPGDTGEFVRDIGNSVIIALFGSLFLSLTVIPAFAGRLSTFKIEHQRKNLPNFLEKGLSNNYGKKLYHLLLDRAFKKPMFVIVFAMMLSMLGFLMALNLNEQFFPPSERDQFYIEVELPTQTSLEQTKNLTVEIENKIIDRYPQIDDIYWFVGEHGPEFYYNLDRQIENQANFARALVQLKSFKKSDRLINELQTELDRVFSSAQIVVRQIEQGPLIIAPLEVRIYGSNLKVLEELGNQVRRILSQTPDLTHTRTNLITTLPKLGLQIDEEKAILAQIDNLTIARQLNINLEGSLGGTLLEATEELPVRVRQPNSERDNIDSIASSNLLSERFVLNRNGESIPLSAIAEFKLISEPAAIARRNGRRVNTVRGFITANILPSQVLTDFKQRLEASNFQLPPGYYLEYGGEKEARDAAVDKFAIIAIFLFLLMAIVLILSLNSFRLACIIFLVAILSIGMGLLSLWMFNYPFGFMAILGTVGLVGIAVNDSIVVIIALRCEPKVCRKNRKAAIEVINRSTRHVLTTTITTLAGFLPLFLDGGDFWPPLVIPITGGVTGATFLSLFFVPCIYLQWFNSDKC